jgi:signal transduction histidine kinase
MNTEDRKDNLIRLMLEMNQSTEEVELFKQIVTGANKLVPEAKVWFGKLDYETGRIFIKNENARPTTQHPEYVEWGVGISGAAVAKAEVNIAGNVHSPEWEGIYSQYWGDTISEVAIPVLIDNITIRTGTKVRKNGRKIVGVLNLEVSRENAFTKEDVDLLELLASHGALLLERLDYEKKMHGIRKTEQTISELQLQNASDNKIVNEILDNINKILGFKYINISLVDQLRTQINSEYFRSEYETPSRIEEFKKETKHLLNIKNNDIQADIVRTKKIEVPNPDEDPRYDMYLYEKYNHSELIRVYIPVIDPVTDQTIGTVEAGYKRKYREYIGERDIQLLKSFVDCARYAIISHREETVEKVIHELRAPIVAIRSHADLLQAYWFSDISFSRPDVVANKLQDVLTDSEIILQNIAELEYLLIGGRPDKKLKSDITLIYRDILLKTVYQLKPLMQEHGLPYNNVTFIASEKLKKFRMVTDKYRLAQVVYNLFTNAVKYYDDRKPSNEFRIVIEMRLQENNLVISFKDWGMGIEEEYRELIFKTGFRTPKAESKNVTGAGLGLSISKVIMNELKGDLYLNKNTSLTDFIIILPTN